jgi:toxin secretion/phage lysis holin
MFFTAFGAALGAFLGGVDGFLYTLIVFVVVDYVTGFLAAVAEKNLSSEVGFRGIAKKVVIFLLVGVANLIDVNVLGQGAVIRTAVIFFYLSNEGVSILENAGRLGLPIPKKLRQILEQLKDEDSDELTDEIYLDDCFSEEPDEDPVDE